MMMSSSSLSIYLSINHLQSVYSIYSLHNCRYCTVVTNPDGSVSLSGARSKRGKMRGPPGSRSWNQALKNLVRKNDEVRLCLRFLYLVVYNYSGGEKMKKIITIFWRNVFVQHLLSFPIDSCASAFWLAFFPSVANELLC